MRGTRGRPDLRGGLESINPIATEAAFPRAEQIRLASRLVHGCTPDLGREIDAVLARLELTARQPPPAKR